MKVQRKIQFQQGWGEADGFKNVRIGDRSVPDAIDVTFPGIDGQPGIDMRFEVIDGVPQCRDLRITSTPGGREIRTLDLRAVQLTQWVEQVFAAFAGQVIDETDGVVTVAFADTEEAQIDAVRQMQEARRGKAARRITLQLLQETAKLYTEHFNDRPISAVARAFGVGERTASKYVTLARRGGHLPKTTRGKKLA